MKTIYDCINDVRNYPQSDSPAWRDSTFAIEELLEMSGMMKGMLLPTTLAQLQVILDHNIRLIGYENVIESFEQVLQDNPSICYLMK